MNRLNRMTGLVSVIIGLFCACQGTAKPGGCGDRFEGNVCRPSFLHARHRASRFSRLSGKYL